MEKEDFVKDPASVFAEEVFPDNDMSTLVDSDVYLSMVQAVLDKCPNISLDEAAGRVDDVLDKLPGRYELVKIEENDSKKD